MQLWWSRGKKARDTEKSCVINFTIYSQGCFKTELSVLFCLFLFFVLFLFLFVCFCLFFFKNHHSRFVNLNFNQNGQAVWIRVIGNCKIHNYFVRYR